MKCKRNNHFARNILSGILIIACFISLFPVTAAAAGDSDERETVKVGFYAMDDPVSSSIAIIAMTANAFDEDRQKALEAGMDYHIAKPINMDILEEALADIWGS